MKRIVYDHGLPFGTKLAENVDDIMDRVDKKKASMIILDGELGEGKTTLATLIARKIEGDDPTIDKMQRFDFRAQIGMGGDDFLKKADWCSDNKKRAIIYDEAGDFSKRGALTKFNQRLITFFDTYRAFKIIPILCLPTFWRLDNMLFEQGVARMLVHCHHRVTTGNYSAFDMDNMDYMRYNLTKLRVKAKVYNTVRANFRGHFLNLPPKLADMLDMLSTRAKKSIMKRNILDRESMIDVYAMATKMSKSVKWVRNKIVEHNVKHIDIIQRRKYYDKDTLRLLVKKV